MLIFSGSGFKLGPVTGNMIADLATGVHQCQPQEILSLRNKDGNGNENNDNKFESVRRFKFRSFIQNDTKCFSFCFKTYICAFIFCCYLLRN